MKKYILILILLIFSADAYWEKVENIPPDFQNIVYLDVYFLPENPDLGWVCGFQSAVLYTTDGGESWEGTKVPQPNMQLEAIMFVNDSVGYSSGPDNSIEAHRGNIFKSTDGGKTWFDISPDDNNFTLWGLYFTDEDYGVITGGGCYSDFDPNYLRSYYTTNGGNSWNESVLNIDDNNVFYYSRFSDPLILDKDGLAYAVSSGVIWKSENGGKEWDIFSYTGNLDWHEEIAVYNETILVPSSIGCDGNYADAADIRISTDNGDTWSLFDTEMSMFGSFLHDELRGWGVGFQAEIYYTSDGGQSWELRNCGIENSADMDDIWFIDDTTGFVVGDGVYRYTPKNPLAPEIINELTNLICKGDTLELSLNKPFDYVEWSTGETTQSITVTEEGKYFAYAENGVCESGYTDTVEVTFFPAPEINIQKSNEGILCEGDTVDITVSGDFTEFYWDDGNSESYASVHSDSTLYFTYISKDSCIFYDSISVEFMPRDEINILEGYRETICSGYTIDLLASEGFAEYRWYDNSGDTPIGTERIQKISGEGFYFVEGINEYGCESYSDTVFIEELDIDNSLEFFLTADSVLNVGEVEYPEIQCTRLIIYNNSDNDFVIDKLQPVRNIEFSVPKSLLPILVPANDTAGVKVCYNPTDIELQRDTLIISDICSDRAIPLKAEGLGYADTTDGICEIPVKFELIDIIDEPFLDIRKIFPSPANESINIEIIAGFPDESDMLYVQIFDIFGNKLYQNDAVLNNITNFEKGLIANGIISIKTDNFESGTYFVKIQNSELVEFKKILIQK